MLAWLVKGTGCFRSLPSGRLGTYDRLIGFNPRWLRNCFKVDDLSRNGSLSMRNLAIIISIIRLIGYES